IDPYTSATALSAGWVWNIPLYGRVGTGYVYSSAFISPDEAEKEFRAHLGPAAEGLKANHIKMRIGRNRNSWVGNCVAIGLASGFVEPLESTGIFFIQHGIEELVENFPRNKVLDDNLIASFNAATAECIDGVREFLTIHYVACTRDDTPFWKATKAIAIPEPLGERMQIWKSRLPNPRSIYRGYHGFEAYSWAVMLLGLGYEPQSSLPMLDHLDVSRGEAMFEGVKRRAH